MKAQSSQRRIGDILVECGMITPEALEEALELSRRHNLRLGEALIYLGALNQDQLTWALGVQFDLSYVDITPEMIDWEMLLRLPLERLLEAKILPFTVVNRTVHAVIADPTAENLGELLTSLFPGYRIVAQLAPAQAISDLLQEALTRRDAEEAEVSAPAPPRPAAPAAARPRLEDSPLSAWLKALACGRWDTVAAYPTGLASGAWRICVTGPDAPPDREMAERDAQRLWETLALLPAASPCAAGLWRAVLPPPGAASGRLVRLLAFRASGTPVITLEAIPLFSQDLPLARTAWMLTGENPLRAKRAFAALSAEGPESDFEPPRPWILLETWMDFHCPSALQLELPDAATRLLAARSLAAALRPQALLIELESEEAALRLAAQFPAIAARAPLFLVLRDPRPAPGDSEGEDYVFPRRAALPADEIEAAAALRRFLEEAAP